MSESRLSLNNIVAGKRLLSGRRVLLLSDSLEEEKGRAMERVKSYTFRDFSVFRVPGEAPRWAVVAMLLASMVLALAAIGVLSETAQAQSATNILYVKQGSSGNCTSWDNACSDLQTALGKATSGDQVWVAAGTYKPTKIEIRSSTFQLKDGVALYGGFTGNESNLDGRNIKDNETTLSGDIGVANHATDNSHHVVTSSGTGSSAVLDGFTVTAGHNTNSDVSVGGGMFNVESSPTVRNVTFSDNGARSGGGMYNSLSYPTLTNVTFSNNSAYNNGGGMFNVESSPTVRNVTFSNNSARTGGGGGMYNYQSSPTLTNVTFSNNSADYGGGGMYNYQSSSPWLINTILWGNTATYGPEIYNYKDSTPLVRYSFIKGQSPSGTGNLDGINPNNSPDFKDQQGGDLRLTSTSRAIDRGYNGEVPQNVTMDLDGNPRIVGGTVDLGAYEFQGQPAGAKVALDSNLLAFGSQHTGTQSSVWALTLTNSGNGSLPVDAVSLTGNDKDQFKIDQDTCSYQSLNPDETCTIEIRFKPTSTGDKQAQLQIESGATTNPDMVSLTGTGTNQPPAAQDQSVTTDEDTAKAVTLTATDLDNDNLTYSVVQGPQHGTLSGNAPNLTYASAENYNGSDSFTYKANDGTEESNTATVSITVNAINDAPVAQDDAATTDAGKAVQKNVLSNDSDPDGDTLTIRSFSQPDNGRVECTNNGVCTYTPIGNFTGDDSFTYRTSDGTAASDSATVKITVNAVNDIPIVVRDTVAPSISAMTPRNRSVIRDKTPIIKAVVKDNITNLSERHIRLKVDGKNVPKRKFKYSSKTDRLVYKSPKLSRGKTRVQIVATDAAKNVGAKSWYFRIR